MEYKRILVPVGGNVADEDAVGLACILAKKNRARIYVTYIVQVARTLPIDAEIRPETERADKVLERASEIAHEQGIAVEPSLIQAREVGPAIVDEASEKDVDLIVLGLTYKTRFGSFNLGVVVPYILKEAACRVIVLREPTA
jgi:nucleotide-binding universal stress UspA family protein